jgi:hypothetical protein
MRPVLLIAAPLLLSILSIGLGSSWKENKNNTAFAEDTAWSVQLNELNFLVMKASSINLINGLHLNRTQAEKLKALSEKVAATLPAKPETYGKCYPEISRIRSQYIDLCARLEQGDSINEAFKNEIYNVRELEAKWVKNSLLGAQQAGYTGKACLKCHCLPDKFPAGKAAQRDPVPVTPAVRKETDAAHVEGLFGKEATLLVWELKEEVDQLLNNGQRCLVKEFRCCLIPSANLQEPERIGQASSNGDWQNFLAEARKLDDAQWEQYKPLFLDPIREGIRATLPGIRKNEIEQRIARIEEIVRTARGLDKMDYEIQKESLCEAIIQIMKVDQLNGEDKRSDEDRMFITAMFLLYFDSPHQYETILKQQGF